MGGHLTLSMKELDRLQLMIRIAERRLTRRHAATLLGLSERQARRLYRAFRRDGADGLVSRQRGRPSARRLPAATQAHALALIRERYPDFGPTFAHQQLTEEHGLAFSVETLRGWMTAAGLLVPRPARAGSLPVWPRAPRAQHRQPLCQQPAGQRPRRARERHPAGPPGEGAPTPRTLEHRRGRAVPAHLHGRLQRALREASPLAARCPPPVAPV